MNDRAGWGRRGPLVALILGGALIILVGAVIWAALPRPTAVEPSPSPTTGGGLSPSPSTEPSEGPTLSPEPSLGATPGASPSPAQSPSPGPSIGPSPSPNGTASPPAGWIEITDFPTYRGSTRIESITVGGPGFVAVGSGGRSLRARVWTSADGLSWTAEPDNVFRGFSVYLVTRASRELYAFGRGHEGLQIWRSNNGRTWTALDASPALEWANINDVAVVGDTMIAVGSINDVEAGDEGSAAWRSTDGVGWQRVGTPAGLDEPWAISGLEGTLVATARWPVNHAPLIVYSTDLGDSWQPASTDLGVTSDFNIGLADLAASNRRFVAVGYHERDDYVPIALTSRDGASWTSVTSQEVGTLGQVVALPGDSFVALGAWYGAPSANALVSDNGRTWRAIAPLYTDQQPPVPPEGGDEVVTERAVAGSRRGVVVAQPWGDGVRVWFGPAEMFH